MTVGSLLSKVLHLFLFCFCFFKNRLSPCQVRFTLLNDSRWNYIWKCYKLRRNLLPLIKQCWMRLSMMWRIMGLRRRRVTHHIIREPNFVIVLSFKNISNFLTTLPHVDFLQTFDIFAERFQYWKGCRSSSINSVFLIRVFIPSSLSQKSSYLVFGLLENKS